MVKKLQRRNPVVKRGTQPPDKVRRATQLPERGRRATQLLGRSKNPELVRRNTQHQINKVSMEKMSRKKGLGRLMELLKLATQQMGSPSPVLRLQGREEWMEWTHVLEIVWSHVWRCV